MKRIVRSAFTAVTVASLVAGSTACNDYLEVKPTAVDTPETIFSTVSGATSALVGVYDLLSGDATYGNRLSSFYPFDSDEMQSSQGGDDAGSGRRGIARYASVATNAEVLNPWNDLYRGIERANVCIKYIPEMAQYQGGSDQATVKRLHGEALTLRAQYFFELVRNWGDVPEPRTPSVTGMDFNVSRADRDQILEHLLDDLALAQTLVPWRSESPATFERITKGAVKALRARIAMYRAGYALRQDGSVRRGTDPNTYYTIARNECSDLMARRGEHTLNTSYEETWRSINELRPEPAHEIIFEASMGGASANSDSKLGYYNGPRITASPKYGQSSGAVTALPTYFYAFDSTDTRRFVTLAPYTIGSSDNQASTTLINVYDGKFRRDWRVPLVPAVSVQSLNYNWPIIRFADVLLMFAEAQNELSGPNAAYNGVTPVQALEEVRRRAFRTSYVALPSSQTSSQSAFFDAIVKERFLEFGGEGIRKYDLIRWNLLTTKITETKATLRAWMTGAGAGANIPTTAYFRVVNGQVQYARSLYRPAPATAPAGTTSVAWRSSITEARVADIASGYNPQRQLLPIPAAAINTNPNLVQNPGY
jgi:hypothetical protein